MAHLIDYHKSVSLEEFNRELKDLKLTNPLVKKARPSITTSDDDGLYTGRGQMTVDSGGGGGGGGGGGAAAPATVGVNERIDPQLASQLLQIHAKWLVKQNDHEKKYEEHAAVMSRLEEQRQALNSFRQTIVIYERQVGHSML